MTNPAPGILLIADPFLKDPNFMRTVVLLTEHDEEGTVGFVLNRQYEYTLEDLVPNTDGLDIPVYYGGPVQPNTVHFVHSRPDVVEGGVEILPGIYWGGDFDQAVACLRSGAMQRNEVRFYIGYSGWSSGQLTEEMEEKTWLTVEATQGLIFDTKAEQIWKDALKHLGGDYEMMIHFPIDPQLN